MIAFPRSRLHSRHAERRTALVEVEYCRPVAWERGDLFGQDFGLDAYTDGGAAIRPERMKEDVDAMFGQTLTMLDLSRPPPPRPAGEGA